MYRNTTRSAAMQTGEVGMEAIVRCQADFTAAMEAHDALAMIEANRQFHISHQAGNSYFAALFERLLNERRRILRG